MRYHYNRTMTIANNLQITYVSQKLYLVLKINYFILNAHNIPMINYYVIMILEMRK